MTTITNTYCAHAETKQIGPDRMFSACVAGWDCDPGAHGNVERTVECVACGSRRSVNANGCHVEAGAWGPTRAARAGTAKRAEQELLEARVQAAQASTTVTSSDGRSLQLSIDDDGHLLISGAPHTDDDVKAACAAWPGGLAVALRLRELTTTAARLQAEVGR